MWSVKCRAWSAGCEVRSAKLRSQEYGVWSARVEPGRARSAENTDVDFSDSDPSTR